MLNLNILKKDDLIKVINKYYVSIGRVQTPKYQDYNLNDLKKCVYLFRLSPDFINKVLEDIN
jgi:hypothetical protein